MRRVVGLHAATLGFPFSRLNAVLFHGRRPVNTVQFIVEATCVADWFANRVATPKRRHGGFAIAARETYASRSGLKKYEIVIIHVAARLMMGNLRGNEPVAEGRL